MEDKYKFCYQCGGKLQEKIEIAFCPYCGERVETDGEFCPFCGNALNENSNVRPAVVKSEDKTQILNKDFVQEVKSSVKSKQKNNKYGTTVLGWVVIVLVYLFDLIAGVWAYHVSRLYRLQNIVSPKRLREIGFPVSDGLLILTIFVVYALLFISWYFIKKINIKAAKYLLNIVIVGFITISLIGCLFGYVASSILFWFYLAYAIVSYKAKKAGKPIFDGDSNSSTMIGLILFGLIMIWILAVNFA